MLSERQLTASARRVVDRLKALNLRIVLAESCTGGLVSALLTRIPGVSEFHCGSAVVYQVATKAAWLGVPKTLLQDPGPVSREVASKMASGALEITPHADIAAAVTGHLGPGAPPAQDGLVYVAFARRSRSRRQSRSAVAKIELAAEAGDGLQNPQLRRLRRQRSAAAHLLAWILTNLSEPK
ncbi:MAG TPA: CinA family protein [Planctomycetaceae bacterium]|jgi:PncC family amidohydrolase|nr:CinA family protein [Planctomycetaceae bacterium]